jgi:hypothetical protein
MKARTQGLRVIARQLIRLFFDSTPPEDPKARAPPLSTVNGSLLKSLLVWSKVLFDKSTACSGGPSLTIEDA